MEPKFRGAQVAWFILRGRIEQCYILSLEDKSATIWVGGRTEWADIKNLAPSIMEAAKEYQWREDHGW